MADTKKRNTTKAPAAVPAETDNKGNLEEKVQSNSLDSLKARYDTVEESEEIRNDGFELAKKSGLIRKQRPESQIYGYFSGPVNPKDEIHTDVDSPLAQIFDATKSEFDSNTVSFSDIGLEQEKKDTDTKSEDTPVEAEKPKRKRTTKKAEEPVDEEKPKKTRTTKKAEESVATEEKPKKTRATKKAEESVATEEKPKKTRAKKAADESPAEEKPKRKRTTKKADEETVEKQPQSAEGATTKLTDLVGEIETDLPFEAPVPAPVFNNRYGFDTHTRVIYIDESAEDGIQRNSEEELSSLFNSNESKKKRRLLPWLRRKK